MDIAVNVFFPMIKSFYGAVKKHILGNLIIFFFMFNSFNMIVRFLSYKLNGAKL